MITIADAIEKEFWETAIRQGPQMGDIYIACVGSGKVRPIVVVGASGDEVRYLDCTTRCRGYQKQKRLEGCGLNRPTYLATDRIYIDKASVLLKKIGRVPETYLRFIGILVKSIRAPTIKQPYWFNYAFGRRYAS